MVRRFFAMVFLLVAIVASMGIYAAIQHHQTKLWAQWLEVSLLLMCLFATSIYLFRSSGSWLARMSCPSCKAKALEPSKIQFQRPGILGLLLGSFIYFAWAKARSRNLVCRECGHSTSTRTVGSNLALMWLVWAVVLLATAVANRL